MTFERYTYRSKKRQGYRQNIDVGPKDIFQMKEIQNTKQTDPDKLVDFVDRPIHILFHSSSLPTSVNTSNGDFCASTIDANDRKTQLIAYSNYRQDLRQQVIQNQSNLRIFSFVACVYPTSDYSDHDNLLNSTHVLTLHNCIVLTLHNCI
jgi:hypothetical protein